MANLDSSIPHKFAGATLVIADGGSNTVTCTLKQGTISWSQPGRAYTEAREAGRHASVSGKPVLIETDDGDITGQLTCLVTSFKGSSNTHPYEALTFSGNASSWATTANGSKKSVKLTLTVDSTADGAGSQTIVFTYCVPTSVDVDLAASDGLCQLSCSFTDHENAPTIS